MKTDKDLIKRLNEDTEFSKRFCAAISTGDKKEFAAFSKEYRITKKLGEALVEEVKKRENTSAKEGELSDSELESVAGGSGPAGSLDWATPEVIGAAAGGAVGAGIGSLAGPAGSAAGGTLGAAAGKQLGPEVVAGAEVLAGEGELGDIPNDIMMDQVEEQILDPIGDAVSDAGNAVADTASDVGNVVADVFSGW